MRKAIWIAGIFFVSHPVYALNTDDVTVALFTLSSNRLVGEVVASPDLEDALLSIEEYRNLTALVQSVQNGRKLSDAQVAEAEILCKEALEELNSRTLFGFGGRKIFRRVMKKVDQIILEVVNENRRVDEWDGRQLSRRYRKTLNELLDYAEIRYKAFQKELLQNENSH